ncbi:carbamoyltransferase HypF [Geodermatophilus sp. YIM 151500]|uniref:carbamoyltransferase HypF n=1 Tax=Geodermatophilus sp. YIM 151500 TaxID=2984531 RepID=UPI0021E4459B|nr:carbamoyltransferase HypF [Geodermatophilus sp. YIM 151500]MCV2487919.1 carbamoyltransferase HypF [Geodermatophilus sp. YIM 151500]
MTGVPPGGPPGLRLLGPPPEAGPPAPAADRPGRVRRRFVLRGVVQGVGFRPYVHGLATALGLAGTVHNDAGGLVCDVEGTPEAVDAFAARLVTGAPPLAVVDDVRATDLPPRGGGGFRIERSAAGADDVPTLAAPDVATCEDCLREIADPADRRYRHPFATCTNCGPRFTITTALPYDRATTTMAGFPMCGECAREYADPADRRFHAQPIACPDCGPRLQFLTRDDDGAEVVRTDGDEAALGAARTLLRDGGVLAVKGVGGYHLACRAVDDVAVGTLRRRKRRGAKPFAVMAPDLATARGLVAVDDVAERLLTGPARPIVLLPRRPGAPVAVAPGNPDLGVFLPYTPLHALLLGDGPDGRGPGALVMTSGNLGGEPIVADDAAALDRLGPLADGWLRHDRPIHVPCDDSVVRVVDGEELPVRRSRGYAPLPVALPVAVPPTLAAGAELKNTVCLADGRRAWLSGHVGDMDDLATLEAATAAERHLEHLTTVRPRIVAADAHPGYRSRSWAAEQVRRRTGVRGLSDVQHHHAHVAALLAEHGVPPDRPVVGIAFDGTGYGTDGAVWGGEVLLATARSFRRVAHLGYVPLPGGDVTVDRPYRMALAHLAAAGLAWDPDLPPVAACPLPERRVLAHQLTTGLGCVPTSSVGRLFDAVAALVGVRQVVDFEAQAAIELEAAARGADPGGRRYAFPVRPGPVRTADPAPVVRAVVEDVRVGVPAGVVAARFHAALAELVRVLARAACRAGGTDVVGLTGGVFQNAVLLSAASRALADDGWTVLRHRVVPPNDGGLCLGQALVAGARAAGGLPERRKG